MNELPRQKLCELITQYGHSLCDDPRRTEALLRDFCGAHKREIFCLVSALKERVAADLLASQDGVPQEVLLARLTKRLRDNMALTEDAARWAVESWALALGMSLPAPRVSTPDAPAHTFPPPAPTATPQRMAPPVSQRIQTRGNEMRLTLASGVDLVLVRVQAGKFLMGSAKRQDPQAYNDEMPQHLVHLDEYWIGKYPVTNGQYQACVLDIGCRKPDHWQGGQIPPGKKQHPVVNVFWDDAVAFCRWVGQVAGMSVRLPTEAEWEKAARGTDGRWYPWGNEPPDATRCNFGRNMANTTPTGKYSPRGDSPCGCADMAGNVWEWVVDWYAPYRAGRQVNPTGPASGAGRVLRGGAFNYPTRGVRCAYRDWYNPRYRSYFIGFRVIVVSPVHL